MSSFVAFEKKNGLVGIQKRDESPEELPEYLYVKETAFKKTDETREQDGENALVYVEI